MADEEKVKKIKVVKKEEIGASKKAEAEKLIQKVPKKKSIASTVSDWVDEFQNSRFESAKLACSHFHKKLPQNS